jgi:hypothetical protein
MCATTAFGRELPDHRPGTSHSDVETAGSKILRAINQALAVMLDGQNLDADGGYSVDNSGSVEF